MFTTDVVDFPEHGYERQRFHYVQSFEYEVEGETYHISHSTVLEGELQDEVVVYDDPKNPENATTLLRLKRPFHFYSGLLGGIVIAYGLLLWR